MENDEEGTPKTSKSGKASKSPKPPKMPKEPATKGKAGHMKIPKAAAPKGIKTPHAHLKTPNPGNLFKGKKKK